MIGDIIVLVLEVGCIYLGFIIIHIFKQTISYL